MKRIALVLCLLMACLFTSCSQGVSLIAGKWVHPVQMGERSTQENGEYKIDIKYPYSRNEKIDGLIQDCVQNIEEDFCNVADQIQYESENPPEKYSLITDYKRYDFSQDIVSFKFEITRSMGEDITRELVLCKTFMFSQSREIKLQDILKHNYKETLLPIIRQELDKENILLEDYLDNFVLTRQSIIFFYEKTPVEINFDQIKDILY